MKKLISLFMVCVFIFMMIGFVYADTEETYTLTKLEVTDKGFIFPPLVITINDFESNVITESENIVDVWFEGSQDLTLTDNNITLTIWQKWGNIYFYKYSESVDISTLAEGPNTINFLWEKRGKTTLSGYYNITKTITEISPSPSNSEEPTPTPSNGVTSSPEQIESSTPNPIESNTSSETPTVENLAAKSPENTNLANNKILLSSKEELPETGENDPIIYFSFGGLLSIIGIISFAKKFHSSKQ